MASDPDDIARTAAAKAAIEYVEPEMTIGLGSGRAVWKVVELLGARGGGLRAATASNRTSELAQGVGIEIIELDGTVELDLALDGADEVGPDVGLIKGGGGALLREKIVICAARRFVVVAETPKKVTPAGRALPAAGGGHPLRLARHAPPARLASARCPSARDRRGRALPHRRGALHPRLRAA